MIDFSVLESKADVASSKIKIYDFVHMELSKARAMANLCRYPPDNDYYD